MDDKSRYLRIFTPAPLPDADPVATLLEHFRPRLLAKAELMLLREHSLRGKYEAADLVQDTLFSAHAKFAQCKGTTDQERLAWMVSIMDNRLQDVLRWYRVRKRAVDREQNNLSPEAVAKVLNNIPDDDPTPSSQCRRKETDEELRRALDRMPSDLRNVLLWKEQDNLTYDEIGQLLKCPAHRVRYLFQRAVEELQALLRLRLVP